MANFIVQSKIKLFKEQFGAGHCELARWAVFPVGITSDMLYQLWINFKSYATTPIDMIAVSDVLLSPFFKPVGNGIFEPDKDVRTLFLDELRLEALQNTKNLDKTELLKHLALFVMDYARECLSGEKYTSFRETLLWNAQATLDPAAALRDISTQMQANLVKNNRAEILRLRELLELFAIQEMGKTAAKDSTFNPLFQFSVALKGSFMNVSAPQIQQKVDGLGLVLHTEATNQAHKVQLPASLVSKGVLQKMVLDTPKTLVRKQQILAMLVGINDYTAPLPQLKGTGNDIELIENLLRGQFGETEKTEQKNTKKVKQKAVPKAAVDLKITKLFNKTATKASILEQFRFLANQAQDDDFVFFSYSGMDTEMDEPQPTFENIAQTSNVESNIGSNVYQQQSAYSNAPPQYQQSYSEPAKKIGMLLPYDSKSADSVTYENYLIGSDILEIVESKPRVNFVFWLDCCKSYNFFTKTLPNMVSLNACSTGQVASELEIEGKTQGIFSYRMVEVLTKTPHISYERLIAATAQNVAKSVKTQKPYIQADDDLVDKIFLRDSFQKAPKSEQNTEGDKTTKLFFDFDAGTLRNIFLPYFKNKLDRKKYEIADFDDKIQEKDTFFAIYDRLEHLDLSQGDYQHLQNAQNVFVICESFSEPLIDILEKKDNAILFTGCSRGEEPRINDYTDGEKYNSSTENYRCGLFIKTFFEVLERQKGQNPSYSLLFSEIYKAVALKTDAQRPQLLTFGEVDLSLPFFNLKDDDKKENDDDEDKNTEGATEQHLRIGFVKNIDAKSRENIVRTFRESGSSLFFDLVDNQESLDYLLCREDGKIYLRTPYDETPVFGKVDEYDLISLFNSIDSVANWHFTLEMKPKHTEKTDSGIQIDFYKINKMRKVAEELVDWKIPIVIDCEPDKEAMIKVKITNNASVDKWVSALYLGKDFGVMNDLLPKKRLKPTESAWLEYDNNAEIPLMMQREYIKQNKKQITEYIKILFSENEFDTSDFNRAGLELADKGATRDLGTRATLSQKTLGDISVKTIIYTLKLKDDFRQMSS